MKHTLLAIVSLFPGSLLVAASPDVPSYPSCDVSSLTPYLPPNQNNLAVPGGQHVTTISLGVGVQNYTCSDKGNYLSTGAVAELFDISCLFGSKLFDNITSVAFEVWNATDSYSPDTTIDKFNIFLVFGQHYFIKNPFGNSSNITPVFDARAASHIGDDNAYTIEAKIGNITAPTGSQDADWLQLKNVQGNLAQTVFRLETKFGQPPKSCEAGSKDISVKYTAKYWFLS